MRHMRCPGLPVLGVDGWHLARYIAKEGEFSMEATLDGFVRIIIPKGIRHDMALEPGTAFQIEKDGEGIVLQPLHVEPLPI